MTRIVFVVFIASALIVAALAVQGDPGAASLNWLGWRVDTTAAAAVLIIGALALAATAFWRVLLWIVDAPARSARARAETRRRQAAETLTRGFLESAAGRGAEARRLAQRATELSAETPQLVRLLAAQSAETAGDRPAAESAWRAMLGFPEMRLAAYRGLMTTALAAGDGAEALANARLAYDLPGTAPWAWRALLQDRLDEADWSGALELAQEARERRIVSPLIAERARAALQTARAAELEAAGKPGEALELAQPAAKARPDFTPVVALTARLLEGEGRAQRAAPLLEAAWSARPHPAVWLAWRDLRTDETPAERAQRLGQLDGKTSREGRILAVERALIGGDAEAARRAAAELEGEPTTHRLAALMARVAKAGGALDDARAWMARAAGAPEEAEWSDIDQTGRAFPYRPSDWARLVMAYTDTGELIHPRLERGEPTISDLPDIPAAYVEKAAFVSAAETGQPFPPIVDDGDFGDALQPAVGEPAPRRGLLGRKLRP